MKNLGLFLTAVAAVILSTTSFYCTKGDSTPTGGGAESRAPLLKPVKPTIIVDVLDGLITANPDTIKVLLIGLTGPGGSLALQIGKSSTGMPSTCEDADTFWNDGGYIPIPSSDFDRPFLMPVEEPLGWTRGDIFGLRVQFIPNPGGTKGATAASHSDCFNMMKP